ncbi:MAG: ABC transporter permease [Propionibacteriaceae bacterium]|nr:ABC transporter permease [Propionibacteriaceae bacterium]
MSQPTATTVHPAGGRLTFAHVLRGEWTKLWSVRSTWWVLGILVVCLVATGLGFSAAERAYPQIGAAAAGQTYASDAPSNGIMFGQLIMAILAVLMIAGEFASGEIKTSLLGAPGRWRVLAAKATVVAGISFVLTAVMTYLLTLAAWPIVRSIAVDDRFTADGLRAAAGAGLAVALVALMALGIGCLVRSVPLAAMIVAALTFVLPMITVEMSAHWMSVVNSYLIGWSTQGLTTPATQIDPSKGIFSFGKALWISALWAFIPLIAGAVTLRKRDV